MNTEASPATNRAAPTAATSTVATRATAIANVLENSVIPRTSDSLESELLSSFNAATGYLLQLFGSWLQKVLRIKNTARSLQGLRCFAAGLQQM